jgi:hypothetical protein
MFSIQIDALGEHTLDEVASNLNQTIADLMFAGHASYRDPSRYLIGLFGGGGWTYDNGDDPTDIDFYFVGAEAQAYWDQFTACGHCGYLDGEDFWLEIVENA